MTRNRIFEIFAVAARRPPGRDQYRSGERYKLEMLLDFKKYYGTNVEPCGGFQA